jgi:hypothetical protein
MKARFVLVFLMVVAVAQTACTQASPVRLAAAASRPQRTTYYTRSMNPSITAQPDNPLMSLATASAKVPFKPLLPHNLGSRPFLGARVYGKPGIVDGCDLDMEYAGDLSIIERSYPTTSDATEGMRGPLLGGFNPSFMVHTTVNGQPAIGWDPVDNRKPGGMTVPYSGLVYQGADGKMVYTLFGGTTQSMAQLVTIAESLAQ